MRQMSVCLCGVLVLCTLPSVRADEEADAEKLAEAEAAFEEFTKAFIQQYNNRMIENRLTR